MELLCLKQCTRKNVGLVDVAQRKLSRSRSQFPGVKSRVDGARA